MGPLQRVFISATILTLLVSRAPAQDWSPPLEVPDRRGAGGDLGTYNSMAVVTGRPAIVSFDQAHKRIYWTRALDSSGTAWEQPRQVFDAEHSGPCLSLRVVNGHPAIAYRSYYGNDVMYARALDPEGLSWGDPVVVDTALEDLDIFSSLEVVNGRPAIAYRHPDTYRLKYARALDADGSAWSAPITVDDFWGTGQHACLRVVNGRPAIAYANGNAARYVHASDADGGTWGLPVFVGIGSNVWCTSMCVIGGIPCVAYKDDVLETMSFARADDADGTSWSSNVPVNGNGVRNVGGYVQLLDAEGYPLIVHMEPQDKDLIAVRATAMDGSAWDMPQVLVSAGQVGGHGAVAIVDGNPAVACHDNTRKDLLYTRATTPDGAGAWSDPIHLDSHPRVGRFVSHAVVEGHLALAYQCSTDSSLRFVRALDSAGTMWSTSVDVETTIHCGKHAKLAVVNSLPMVAHVRTEGTLQQIVLSRANDALGTTWSGPTVIVDGLEDVASISFASIGGYPAILYNDDYTVHYLRALDANGTAWPSNSQLNVNGSGATALLELNGVPLAIYSQSGDVVARRGNNADGTSWAAPVDAGTNGPEQIGAAIIAGNPAICYTNALGVRYARCNDALGNTWADEVWAYYEQANDASDECALQEIDGRPAVVFHAYLTGTHYVRAYDAAGSSWPVSVQLDDFGWSGMFPNLLKNGTHTIISYYNADREYPYVLSGAPCTDQPPPPSNSTPLADLTVCPGSITTLNAEGEGTIGWYSTPTGGALLGSGSSFVTNWLSESTTFHVESFTCMASATRTPITVTVHFVDTSVTQIPGGLSADLDGATYQWYDCSGTPTPVPGATGQTFLPTESGEYEVHITDSLCTGYGSCYSVIITGNTDLHETTFRIGPVPAVSVLTIEGAHAGDRCTIHDVSGRAVWSGQVSASRCNISVEAFPSGTYVLHLLGPERASALRFVVAND